MVDVIEAIKGRRTVSEFSSDPVSREQVLQMLEAAIWAPNHKLTNPWEFYVVSGHAKMRLACVRADLKRARHKDPGSDEAREAWDQNFKEMADLPWAIYVCQRLEGSEAQQQEDLLAVGCAIQNLMLAAHSMGIGTLWGTGPLINEPATFAALGVPAGRRAVGLIWVGRPAGEQEIKARRPLAEVVHWVE